VITKLCVVRFLTQGVTEVLGGVTYVVVQMSHIHGVTRLSFPVSIVVSFNFTTAGETSHSTANLSKTCECETAISSCAFVLICWWRIDYQQHRQ
jgi:hypothetical protein